MAKRINSLALVTRKLKANEANNIKKALSKNSPKNLRAKEELNRRAIRDINSESHKRPARRALKKSLGSQEREHKTILPENLFKTIATARGRGFTPRQKKRLFKRPNEFQDLLNKHYNHYIRTMSEVQISLINSLIETEECEPAIKAA